MPVVLLALPALLGSTAASARAAVYATRDEALVLAFGDSAHVATRTVYPTDEQAAEIQALAGAPFDAGRVTFYEATGDGGAPLGHAYIDTHPVRSMAETILVVVSPEGRVERVEVLALHEPEEYRAPERWLGLLEGRALSSSLAPDRELPNLAGATLTARALAAAVRRVLALHRVMVAGPEAGVER
jgi:hypothetical protein